MNGITQEKMTFVIAVTNAKKDSLKFWTLKLSSVYHKKLQIAIGKIYGVLSSPMFL